MARKTETEKSNFRYNIITIIIYIIGVILLVQLFNLQIVKGKEYREQSNTRLSREADITAARGQILDRTGTVLAKTEMGFNVQLFKTKVDENEFNNSLLLLIQILEENGDSYIDEFPISINPFKFNFSSDEALEKWKKDYDIDSTASPEEAFYIFKEEYKVNEENIEKARKIIGLKYSIYNAGYTATKSVEVAQNITRKSALEIEEKGNELAGITVEVQPNRVYTQGTLASHLIGYISRINEEEYNQNKGSYNRDDYIGKTGIEYVFEKYLKGQDGTKQIDMSVDGTTTGEYITKEAIGGANVVLTIDANLQYIAENALKNNIEKIKSGGFGTAYDAQGGAVVVLNIKTGEILAMASYPDYEPGQFINGITQSKLDEYTNNSALLNRAIQGTYAPGSIFKMVTALAGLQEGVITTKEKINDTGVYPRAHKPVCWYYTSYHSGHGRLNVSEAIQKSCNYFFYETGYRLGIEKLAQYANYFGLGKKTGIELPYEKEGSVASVQTAESKGQKWTEGSILSAAIGQSYNDFTPIQMVKYIGMVANRGKIINPTLVQSVVKSDGTQVPKSEVDQYVNERLGLSSDNTQEIQFSEENLNAVLEGMRSVTDDRGGTAYSIFRDFDITVGGKTGSAEAGKYTNAWFAGFAPFEDPEIAVVVLVENGGHGYYTAEIVKEIIGEYFGMNIQEVKEDMSASYETESIR